MALDKDMIIPEHVALILDEEMAAGPKTGASPDHGAQGRLCHRGENR